MSVTGWIALSAILTIFYCWYAAIVSRRNRSGEALAGVDVQLTQRHDLVPNLLKTAARFMTHERELFDSISANRSAVSDLKGATDPEKLDERFKAEQLLGASLQRFMAVAESYPELKSDRLMLDAQRALQEVETNIAAARRFYNSAVGSLRNAVQIFPGPLLARLAGVAELPPFFEAGEQARTNVDAGAYL